MNESRRTVIRATGRACTVPVRNECLQMMAVSWHASDEKPAGVDGQESGVYVARQYTVRLFGCTDQGVSVSATLTGFLPSFYVLVEEAWGPRGGIKIRDWLAHAKGSGWKVASTELIRKKDYVGFRNGATREFVTVRFSQQYGMRQMSRRLLDGLTADGGLLDLTLLGIPHRGAMKVYESNIDPLIRVLHRLGVQPAGWVRIQAGRWATIDGSSCQLDVQCLWSDLHPMECNDIAPILVLSLDIECGSSHGDFPQAKKGLNKLAMDLTQAYTHAGIQTQVTDEQVRVVIDCLDKAFGFTSEGAQGGAAEALVSRVFPKATFTRQRASMRELAESVLTELCVQGGGKTAIERVKAVLEGFLEALQVKAPTPQRGGWGSAVPEPAGLLRGDPVIQIGLSMHVYGDATCCRRHILTLGCCDAVEGVCVHEFQDEASLLLGFTELITRTDPDMLIGYNQFGFDFAYLNGRSEELGVSIPFSKLGRVSGAPCGFRKQTLSSSALGDNEFRYFEITGRCQIDLMKLVQRDHKLNSYKLDFVAEHFTGMRKQDLSPADIFRLQLGSPADRALIAKYCVQDCALCNHLLMKLEVVANNVGMANVCCVPLSFLFLRGQGVKVLSLVAKRSMAEGFLIPTPCKRLEEETGGEDGDSGYEGAIVLEPETGLYLREPVSVLDFASLYPSSIISGNLSHDTYVMDPAFDNLPGVEYSEVCYDTHEGQIQRQEVCRFAKTTMGVLPMILQDLLSARRSTRARIKALQGSGADAFLLAVLDGQQVAIKVTANSVYGQMGARTSALYLKPIAACTTAIGRAMILRAKAFLEHEHGARVIYGDTDSVFAVFPDRGLIGRAALQASIDEGSRASIAFNVHLPAPHDLEYEKTFFPFFLLSKKRYVGKKFVRSSDEVGEISSMGIVTKRRDNAPIVKTIYGGILDILLERQDVTEAELFLTNKLMELVSGQVGLDELVVSKALKGFYKTPDTIAHYVLARRMGDRDPGSRPQVNDRVPYVYIVAPQKLLQGERIEDPSYVRAHAIPVDTTHYVTNQIMKPVVQLLSLALERLSGFRQDARIARGLREVTDRGGDITAYREAAAQELLFAPILKTRQVKELEKKRQRLTHKTLNAKTGQRELTDFFTLS